MTANDKSPINLIDPSFYADPYPAYAWLRQHDPVHWYEPLQTWLLTGHEDVATSLRDPRFTKQHYSLGVDYLPPEERARHEPFLRRFGMWLLFKDGEPHAQLRKLMNQGFTPKAVTMLRPHVEAVTDRLLDEALARGSLDLMDQLANPLPALIIAHMLGVEEHDWRMLSEVTNNITHFIAMPVTDEIARKCGEGYDRLEQIFQAAIEKRRQRPVADEVLSLLVAAEAEGKILTTEELCSQCILLFAAGHETTRNLIGNGVLALLRNPDQLELLRRDPSLIPGAIDELLRYDSPIQFSIRRLTSDVEMGGKRICAGQIVYAFIGAVNRDPAVFPDPDRLDVRRAGARKQLAFGLGAHYCLGASLARLEAEVAIGRLLARAPRIRLATEELRWFPNPAFHGVTSLPLLLS